MPALGRCGARVHPASRSLPLGAAMLGEHKKARSWIFLMFVCQAIDIMSSCRACLFVGWSERELGSYKLHCKVVVDGIEENCHSVWLAVNADYQRWSLVHRHHHVVPRNLHHACSLGICEPFNSVLVDRIIIHRPYTQIETDMHAQQSRRITHVVYDCGLASTSSPLPRYSSIEADRLVLIVAQSPPRTIVPEHPTMEQVIIGKSKVQPTKHRLTSKRAMKSVHTTSPESKTSKCSLKVPLYCIFFKIPSMIHVVVLS